MRSGNYKLAHECISALVKHANYGFNQLHADALSEKKGPLEFHNANMGKKAHTCLDMTPMHCVCANPNPAFLEQLLKAGGDINLQDRERRKPIHYAAGCVSAEPFKLLLKSGASVHDVDDKLVGSIHIAAMTGRAEQIKLILGLDALLVNAKDKAKMTPLAYACKGGHTEAAKALLEF